MSICGSKALYRQLKAVFPLLGVSVWDVSAIMPLKDAACLCGERWLPGCCRYARIDDRAAVVPKSVQEWTGTSCLRQGFHRHPSAYQPVSADRNGRRLRAKDRKNIRIELPIVSPFLKTDENPLSTKLNNLQGMRFSFSTPVSGADSPFQGHAAGVSGGW